MIHSKTYLELHFKRIEARVVAENGKSQTIPKRFGFTKEGETRQAELLYDHYVDHVIHALLVEYWNKLNLLYNVNY